VKISRLGIVASALPGVVALAIFCSLAVHIHMVGWQLSSIPLGYWPPAIESHFSIAGTCFALLFYWTILVLPIALLVCLAVSRWRRFAIYIGVHLFFCVAALFITSLAPASFVQWLTD
jgi:hypothetical protein